MSVRAREDKRRRVQNRIIWFGLIATVLTQYAWLFPGPALLVFAAVALVCAVVVLGWKAVEWLT